jgi:hypothetical protein
LRRRILGYRWPSAFSDLGLPGLVVLGIGARVLTLQFDEETGAPASPARRQVASTSPYRCSPARHGSWG